MGEPEQQPGAPTSREDIRSGAWSSEFYMYSFKVHARLGTSPPSTRLNSHHEYGSSHAFSGQMLAFNVL